VDSFATHRLPLAEAPHGYDMFQKKEDNAVKVLLRP
jgi:threonine dehydrogenase-like Zn-dependent dehydrogenase